MQPNGPSRQLSSITSDGVTVWVNGASGLLGRFGRNGIDIHRPASEQQTKGECLFCTHEKTTPADWEMFVRGMQTHHGIFVHPRYMPDRFRRSAPTPRRGA